MKYAHATTIVNTLCTPPQHSAIFSHLPTGSTVLQYQVPGYQRAVNSSFYETQLLNSREASRLKSQHQKYVYISSLQNQSKSGKIGATRFFSVAVVTDARRRYVSYKRPFSFGVQKSFLACQEPSFGLDPFTCAETISHINSK